MTLHLIALPHTRVTSEFVGCAYTAKSLKFTKMMADTHDVVLYAPEGSTDEFTAETVNCLDDTERQRIFGTDDPARLPAWPTDGQAALFNAKAARELATRWAPGDLVLLTAGMTQKPIIDMGRDEITYCEPGVGYEGIVTPFCAFESHIHRHVVYAKQGIQDGRWFDTVIPNYFDTDDFPRGPLGDEYLLFLGRIVPRKGPQIALEIAKAAGLPLWVAGAGAEEVSEGRIVAGKGTPDEVILEGDVQHIGPVNARERSDLMLGARALVCPTTYLEPFGGVAVEAQLSGTPVVCTDWGAFTETVVHGMTGFRFSTLQEGVDAVERCAHLDRARIRHIAASRYSLGAVAPLFTSWFERLDTLHRDGWYEMSPSPAIISA